MKIRKLLSLIAALIATSCSAQGGNPNVEVVAPRQFQSALSSTPNAYLLDARTPDEFAAGHLEGAHLIDWLNPDSFKREAMNIDKNLTIFIYCRSGRRSNAAANYLAGEGYHVIDMKGGILAWEKEGFPTVITPQN